MYRENSVDQVVAHSPSTQVYPKAISNKIRQRPDRLWNFFLFIRERRAGIGCDEKHAGKRQVKPILKNDPDDHMRSTAQSEQNDRASWRFADAKGSHKS